MRMTCLPASILLIALIALAAATSTAFSADVSTRYPLSIHNCGTSTTYADAPQRVFTMNQAATEIMLALGLHDRMVGTAFLDDAILPEFAAAYETIQVRATAYPSREVLVGARPDFVYAAYPSGFSEQVAGMKDLLQSGTHSYLSPAGCRDQSSSNPELMEMVFGEIRDIGRIFGVLSRAEQLIATYRAVLTAVRDQLGPVNVPSRVLWWDSGMPPFVGGCCGAPNEILRLAGGANVFDDVRGSWGTVMWQDVVERNPDVIVLVDATWAPAAQKRQWLLGNSALSGIEAVKHRRFVTINFSDATPGIRNVAAVHKIAEALYPDRFKLGEARNSAN
jgi:iron complex transport system substrate-binding protein